MANRREDIHDKQQREAEAALRRTHADTETVGTSGLARMAEKAIDHMEASDADPDDRIEIWGTRIARILSAVFVVFLLVYLFRTYILN